MANNTKNLANAIVATDISTSATTLVLEAGYGASMPATPFFLTCTPPGQLSTLGNSEVVLVTARTSDSLTIEREKKGTMAKEIKTGWVVSNSVYVETSTQIGDIITTMNATPRLGRLFMAGGTFNKADYPLMWQHVVDNPAYGTTTTTTFTLKDMSGRVQAGKSTSGTFSTLGAVMGAEAVALAAEHNGPHSHAYRLNLMHSDGTPINGEYIGAPLSGGPARRRYLDATEISGSGTPHNNIQPTMVVNYEVIAE